MNASALPYTIADHHLGSEQEAGSGTRMLIFPCPSPVVEEMDDICSYNIMRRTNFMILALRNTLEYLRVHGKELMDRTTEIKVRIPVGALRFPKPIMILRKKRKKVRKLTSHRSRVNAKRARRVARALARKQAMAEQLSNA